MRPLFDSADCSFQILKGIIGQEGAKGSALPVGFQILKGIIGRIRRDLRRKKAEVSNPKRHYRTYSVSGYKPVGSPFQILKGIIGLYRFVNRCVFQKFQILKGIIGLFHDIVRLEKQTFQILKGIIGPEDSFCDMFT